MQCAAHNGVRDGQITYGKFNRLENGEARINRAEARARADGVVTPVERNHINSMQNRESREISRDRHNDRVPAGGTTRSMAGGTHNPSNGWQHQQPTTGGTTTASASTPHNWGGQAGAASRNSSGQTRTVSNTSPTPALSYGGGRGGNA